jgi:hypothetical protein
MLRGYICAAAHRGNARFQRHHPAHQDAARPSSEPPAFTDPATTPTGSTTPSDTNQAQLIARRTTTTLLCARSNAALDCALTIVLKHLLLSSRPLQRTTSFHHPSSTLHRSPTTTFHHHPLPIRHPVLHRSPTTTSIVLHLPSSSYTVLHRYGQGTALDRGAIIGAKKINVRQGNAFAEAPSTALFLAINSAGTSALPPVRPPWYLNAPTRHPWYLHALRRSSPVFHLVLVVQASPQRHDARGAPTSSDRALLQRSSPSARASSLVPQRSHASSLVPPRASTFLTRHPLVLVVKATPQRHDHARGFTKLRQHPRRSQATPSAFVAQHALRRSSPVLTGARRSSAALSRTL